MLQYVLRVFSHCASWIPLGFAVATFCHYRYAIALFQTGREPTKPYQFDISKFNDFISRNLKHLFLNRIKAQWLSG